MLCPYLKKICIFTQPRGLSHENPPDQTEDSMKPGSGQLARALLFTQEAPVLLTPAHN